MNIPLQRKIILIQVGLIIIMGFAVYANSLKGEFIRDDINLVQYNTYIKDWSKVLNIFMENVGSGSLARVKADAYRPLQMLTYMIDYSIWGLNVLGYHITNTLLHILVTLLIYWLISILYNNRLLSFLTSIIFVVHPVNTEAVSYISGRGDLLSASFILLCIIFYIKYLHSESIGLYISILLSCILAILSKENALILPILLLLYHYAFKKRIQLKLFLPILSTILIYKLLRVTSLASFYYGLDTLLHRVPGFFVAITQYSRILLFPINLHMEYGNKIFGFTEPKALFGLLIFLSLLIYAFTKRNSYKMFFFSVCWFFIALLPTSSIYPVTAFYMAEHWLYLPSIGFFLILANGLSLLYKIPRTRFVATGLLVCSLFSYSFLTIRQNNYWREEISFYERTLKYAPFSASAYNDLGSAYLNRGNIEKAIGQFQKAIEISPKMAIAYYGLGNAYLNRGNIEKAIDQFQKAIEISPKMAIAYYGLGNAYLNRGNIEKAIDQFQKAIENDSNFAIAHFNLAISYFQQKKYDLAIKHCDRAIELGNKVDPEFLKLLKPYRN